MSLPVRLATAVLLFFGELVGDVGNDVAGQRDVSWPTLHARGLGEGLHEGQEGVGGQRRGLLVGFRADDPGYELTLCIYLQSDARLSRGGNYIEDWGRVHPPAKEA